MNKLVVACPCCKSELELDLDEKEKKLSVGRVSKSEMIKEIEKKVSVNTNTNDDTAFDKIVNWFKDDNKGKKENGFEDV